MKFSTLILAVASAGAGLGLVSGVQAQQGGEGFVTEGFEARGPRHGPGAADGGQHRRGPGKGFGHHRGAGGLERLDSDADDFVDESEFVTPRLANIDRLFDRLDQDDDALLSPEELEKPERPAAAEFDRDALSDCIAATVEGFEPPLDLAERFDTMDTDDDSSVDIDELESALTQDALQRFALLDSDADGILDADEIAAAREQALALREAAGECLEALRSASDSD